MGKKTKKSKAGNGEVDTGMPRHVRRDIMEICNSLLEKCSVPFGNRSTEWNDYLDVYNIVEKLRKKQQHYVISHSRHESQEVVFIEWLAANGVKMDAITIDKYGDAGYGLKATRDLDVAELFLAVPYKLMMTSESANASILGPLIQSDRMLQSMPNVAMALHVLCELAQQDSFWQPYLKMLPETYTTSLYFTPDDLQLLKGSPVLSECLNQFRSITRQYAYFFRLFQGHPETSKLPIKNLCYDDYRWAASTVMTRQNEIPVCLPENLKQTESSHEHMGGCCQGEEGKNEGDDAGSGMELDSHPPKRRKQTALIPLWDFCNHTNGHLTTDFNDSTLNCECCSLKHYSRGEQVCIFYGPRSNGELLLHSGFVYDDNYHDKLAVRMGLSKNDPLYSLKAEVLARVLSNEALRDQVFNLRLDPVSPVDSNTLAYLRVFSLDKDALYNLLVGEKAMLRQRCLRDFDRPISRENEMKAWSFLQTRCQILLRSYPTSQEEDTDLLDRGSLSGCARLAVLLRRCEKRILSNVAHYAEEQAAHASLLQPDAITDMTLEEGRSSFDENIRYCMNALRMSEQRGEDVGVVENGGGACGETELDGKEEGVGNRKGGQEEICVRSALGYSGSKVAMTAAEVVEAFRQETLDKMQRTDGVTDDDTSNVLKSKGREVATDESTITNGKIIALGESTDLSGSVKDKSILVGAEADELIGSEAVQEKSGADLLLQADVENCDLADDVGCDIVVRADSDQQ